MHPLGIILGWALIIFSLLNPAQAAPMKIAVIGTGDVAGALGPEFAAMGHRVTYGSRNPTRQSVLDLVERTGNQASAKSPADSAKSADIVVLAVPGQAVASVTRSLGDLTGKIIIDPTNPLGRVKQDANGIDDRRSNTEIIQAAAPGAFAVKAFSTLNYRQMIDPDSSGGPISIIMAGDSAEAKSTVAELADAMGLDPIDVGPLENARHIESLLLLWINNRREGRDWFEYHLRKVPSKRP